MKNKQLLLPKILLIFGLFFMIPNQVEAQFLKKLKQKAEKKIEREAEKRAERRMNKKIDKQFDKAEDVLDGKKKNGKKGKKNENANNKNGNSNSQGNNQNSENTSEINGTKVKKPNVSWSRFDFVPGDTVIFEDSPGADEENGEFPSRWDLKEGNAEIMSVDGENVICFPQGGQIIPYLKNSKDDYLPEIFTIELDAYYTSGWSRRLWVDFYDAKNQESLDYKTRLTLHINSAEVDQSDASLPNKIGNSSENGGWRHISIAFTKGKLKVYINDTRLINIPHFEANPTGLTLEMDGYHNDKPEDIQYIKNIRIAKGGVKYYDRVLSEGKIVVNGIKFDVNKATLKPESMGPINKIYELMQKNTEINFSVEGHTDSDGDDASNMTLSKARGKSVMNKLIEMGISANRLKSDGFGESKPIDNNSTPEGKANNRRVEFVKFAGNSNTSSNNSTGNSSDNSEFDKINYNTIDTKWDDYPSSSKIPISNRFGVVNGKGTIIIYGTSDGDLGKMEILNVDKNDNNKLTIKYVTYDSKGNIKSESNHLEIPGTYTCDLDKGLTENLSSSDEDFWYQNSGNNTTSINARENTMFKIYK